MRGLFAAARAEWLADLISALDDARLIVERMDVIERRKGERAELLGRIIATRSEVRAMQLRQPSRLEWQFDPQWIGLPEMRSRGKAGPHTPTGKSPPPAKGSR